MDAASVGIQRAEPKRAPSYRRESPRHRSVCPSRSGAQPLEPLPRRLRPWALPVIADDAFQEPDRLVVLFQLGEGPGRFHESSGVQLRIVVRERHDQQSIGGVLELLLLEAAQADLKLRLGAGLRRRAIDHLLVLRDGWVILLLILQRPAHAVMRIVDPGAAGKRLSQSLEGAAALFP